MVGLADVLVESSRETESIGYVFRDRERKREDRKSVV